MNSKVFISLLVLCILIWITAIYSYYIDYTDYKKASGYTIERLRKDSALKQRQNDSFLNAKDSINFIK